MSALDMRRGPLWSAMLVLALHAMPAAAQSSDELFDGSVLHRVDLVMHSRDWESLKANFRQNEYYPADLRWGDHVARNVGIRSRGTGSRNGSKPGLRVDFNWYVSSQTFAGLKSLVLDNLVQDPSGLRERLAMRVYARVGLPAPREAFAMLFVNGDYAGVYAMVEPIDKVALRRLFGDRDGRTEDEGYLFEYEWREPYYFTYLGSDPAAYVPFFQSQTHEHESLESIYRPLESMLYTLNHEPDSTFTAEMSPYLDLTTLVRHLAVQAYLAAWDGLAGYAGANNFYLYRFTGSTRAQFIPWDEDTSFHSIDYPITQGFDDNVLTRRVMAQPALRTAFLRALSDTVAVVSERADAAGTTWIEREILDMDALIHEAMLADPVKPYSGEAFAADVEWLREFARQRGAFVRSAADNFARAAGAPRLQR